LRRRASLAAALLALVLSLPAEAGAMAAGVLIGAEAKDPRGAAVGTVEDLILDVRDGRVLYVIVNAQQRSFTLPIRALREREGAARLDMRLAGEIAHADEPRFRRGARLIGQPLEHPGGERIGTIGDIVFEPGDGGVEQVVVSTAPGTTAQLPASVLAHGRFPPLTRWQAEHPSAEAASNFGYLRREPSAERNRLHDHRWPRN
jgi:sporulation protein YlmC with PRC-barrel domain